MAERIWGTELNHGALHPHFNEDGTQIIFSERIPTGKVFPLLKKITPGGENPWDGWRIHLMDFDLNQPEGQKLSHHRLLFESKSGMFEAHGFLGKEKIVFSHTAEGKAYMDDIYLANVDGTQMKNLTNSPTSWDEHGNFAPNHKQMAFISSRFNRSLSFPKTKPNELETELFLQHSQGRVQQLTHFNQRSSRRKRYIVSDFSWDKSGRRIVFQAAPFLDRLVGSTALPPEIWLLTFEE